MAQSSHPDTQAKSNTWMSHKNCELLLHSHTTPLSPARSLDVAVPEPFCSYSFAVVETENVFSDSVEALLKTLDSELL